MGISDRDYMRRRPDDDGRRRDRRGAGAEDLPEYSGEDQLARLLTKYRKALWIGGILLGVLLVVSLIAALASGAGH